MAYGIMPEGLKPGLSRSVEIVLGYWGQVGVDIKWELRLVSG